jgi:Ca2+-binding EF-hand superfamily protein
MITSHFIVSYCLNVYMQDFVTSLSVLARGSIDEKLRWTFALYDLNGDGVVSKAELTTIVSSIYSLMGKYARPSIDASTIRSHVDRVFQVNCKLTEVKKVCGVK